jgi:hypothetical protein
MFMLTTIFLHNILCVIISAEFLILMLEALALVYVTQSMLLLTHVSWYSTSVIYTMDQLSLLSFGLHR